MPIMSTAEQLFCRSAPWRTFARRVVLPWALAGTPVSGDVLELGAGSGVMAEGEMRTHPGISLTVTDLDPAMVHAARDRLAGLAGVAVEQADVTALPFDDGSFDVVTSYLMLHHVIDWPAALSEAARVLRPRGALVGYARVAVSGCRDPRFPRRRTSSEPVGEHGPRAASLTGAHPAPGARQALQAVGVG